MKKLVFLMTVILSCIVVCKAESIILMDFEEYQGGSSKTGFASVIGEYEAAEDSSGGTAIASAKGVTGRLYKKLDKSYGDALFHLSFSFFADGNAGVYIRLTDSEYTSYNKGENMVQSFYCVNQKAGYYSGPNGWVYSHNTVSIIENQWNEADIWLDLLERQAYYYLNGSFIGKTPITDKLKSISGFWFVISAEAESQIKLDNVSMEQVNSSYANELAAKGETVPQCGFEPLAVTFEADNEGKIFSGEDIVKITANYYNKEAYEVTARLSYKVYDSQKKQLWSREKEISVQPGEYLSDEVYPDVSLYDIYDLEVKAYTDDFPEKTAACEFSVANLPHKANADYGICSHTNKDNRTELDKGMPIIQKTGVGINREDFGWVGYETAPGEYWGNAERKEYFENWLAYLEEAGMQPLIIWWPENVNVGVTPGTSIPRIEETLSALSLAAENFAREYKDRVTYYEFSNELNSLSQDKVSCEDYAKALEAFYDGIKRGNPDAFVLGHAVGGTDVSWQEKMLSAGGAEHCDGMGIHYYTRAPEKSFPKAVDELKEMYERNGWEHLEIWITEAITSSSKEYNSQKEQGYYMVRNFVTFESRNLAEKFFVYQIQTSGENEADNEAWFGMINGYAEEDAYGAQPAMLYLTNYFAQTEDAAFEELVEKDDIYIYKYRKNDGSLLLLMYADDGVVPVSIDTGAEKGILKDGYGNETELYSNNGVFTFGLTEDVVYFEVSGATAEILDTPQIILDRKTVCITENDRADFGFETEIDGEILVGTKDNYSVSNMGSGRFCVTIENPDIIFEHIEQNDYEGRDEFKDYIYFSVRKDGKTYANFPVAISYVKACADIDLRVLDKMDDGSLNVELTLKSNRSLSNIYGTLSVISPAAVTDTFTPIYINGLKPNEEMKFTFEIPGSTATGYFNCTALLSTIDGQEVYGYLGECPRSNLYKQPSVIPVKAVKRSLSEPVFDGVLSDGEWADYKLYEFGNKNSDMSAVYYAKWDNDYFYVAARVKDDIHTQNEVASKIRLADSVNVKIKPTYSQRHENRVSFAAAADEARMNLDWTYFDVEADLSLCKFGCTRDDTAGETLYEAKIPWGMLYHKSVEESTNFYLALTVNDKDETETASKMHATWICLTD